MKKVLLMLAIAGIGAACGTYEQTWSLSSPEAYYTSPSKPSREQVKNALKECGFSQPLQLIGNESSDNAMARVTECMFSRGFYLKTGHGGRCSNPDYRAELPACKGAPIRPRWDYYGK